MWIDTKNAPNHSEEAEMRTLLIPQCTATHVTPMTAATTNVFITTNTSQTLHGTLKFISLNELFYLISSCF